MATKPTSVSVSLTAIRPATRRTRRWSSVIAPSVLALEGRASPAASGPVGALGGRRIGAGGERRDRARGRIDAGQGRDLVSSLTRELLPVPGHERFALSRHADDAIGHPQHIVAHDRARIGRGQRARRHAVHLVHGLPGGRRPQRHHHGAPQQAAGGAPNQSTDDAADIDAHHDPVYIAVSLSRVAARHVTLSVADPTAMLRSSRRATTTSACSSAAGASVDATPMTRAPAARAEATPAGASSTTTHRLASMPSRSAASRYGSGAG